MEVQEFEITEEKPEEEDEQFEEANNNPEYSQYQQQEYQDQRSQQFEQSQNGQFAKSRNQFNQNEENQYKENEYQENEYQENQENQENQYQGNQYQDNQYQDSQYQDNQYQDNQYQDNQYQENEYQENQFQDSQFQENQTLEYQQNQQIQEGENSSKIGKPPENQQNAKKQIVKKIQFVQKEKKQLYTINDLLFSGGKFSRIIKIPDPNDQSLDLEEILKKSQIQMQNPVILLSGCDGNQHSKVLQGVVSAAQFTDAVIIDSGLKSGIENMCYNKKVKLIGVCPEKCIVYPTKDSSGDRLSELTPGHSHFMILQKGNN